MRSLLRPFVLVILGAEVAIVWCLYSVLKSGIVRIPTSSNSNAQVPRVYLLALSLAGTCSASPIPADDADADAVVAVAAAAAMLLLLGVCAVTGTLLGVVADIYFLFFFSLSIVGTNGAGRTRLPEPASERETDAARAPQRHWATRCCARARCRASCRPSCTRSCRSAASRQVPASPTPS